MNIKFSYLYRDGANYKNFNEVVFSNPNEIQLEKIDSIIRANLIEGCWFVAKDWNLPDLHFKEYPWDNEIDHWWHESEFVEETEKLECEAVLIDEFLCQVSISKSKYK